MSCHSSLLAFLLFFFLFLLFPPRGFPSFLPSVSSLSPYSSVRQPVSRYAYRADTRAFGVVLAMRFSIPRDAEAKGYSSSNTYIYIYIYSSPRGSSISRIIPLFSPLAFHSFRSSYFFSPVVVSSPLPVSTLYFPTCTRHRYFNDRGGTFIPPLSGYRRMRNFKDETRARLVHYFLSKCFRYFVRVTTRNQIFSNFSSFRIDEIDGGIEKKL